MSFLNNREIATLFWSFLLFGYLIYNKTLRQSVAGIIKAAFQKSLVFIYLLISGYTSFGIYILYKFNLWTIGELKDSILWLAFSGFLSISMAVEAKEKKDFLKKALRENLRFTIILEFILGLYTFSLAWEIILFPIITIIAMTAAFAEKDKKHEAVSKLLNGLMMIYGVFLLFYSIYNVVKNFKDFATFDTGRDLLLSPFLGIWFLPFVFSLAIYMSYEETFIAIVNRFPNAKLLWYAKVQAFTRFNFNLEGLRRWKANLFMTTIANQSDIVHSIEEIKRLQGIERDPPKVNFNLGWSPYEAKDFLKASGIKTRYYTRIFDDEWGAGSDYLNLDDALLPNNISYYIEGTSSIAKKLVLNLNVNQPQESDAAIVAFVTFVEVLHYAALQKDISQKIIDAILKGKAAKQNFDKYFLKIKREDWINLNGYNVSFEINHY